MAMSQDTGYEYGSSSDPFADQMRNQNRFSPQVEPTKAQGPQVPQYPVSATMPQDNSKESIANLNTQLDKENPGSVGSPTPGDPVAFIKSWQQTHSAREGIGPLAEALKAQGISRFDYGGTPSNNEFLINGQKFKVLGGEDNPDTAYWYTGGNDSAPGGVRGTAAMGNLGSFQAGPAMFANGLGSNGEANSLYSLLMDRAKQSISPDRNDPIIRAASDSNNAMLQRGERNYEASVAERAGPHANIGSERRLGAENVAQQSAAFEAQMGAQERQARRTEIQQALEGARGLLTQQQQLALQEELQRLSLAQNESQFGRNLAQNAYQFDVNDAYRYSPFAGGA